MKTLHLRKLLLFKILSLTDLLLTLHLLHDGSGAVYESNPIAGLWLDWYGWLGLVIFKVAMILMVASLCVFISLYQPHTGGRLLWFACCTLAVVVLYSCTLLGHAQSP